MFLQHILNNYPAEWLNLYIKLFFLMSQIVRVTKEFALEMAHALRNYDGPCRNVHGHSYRLFVTISGSPVRDPGNPKYGMVIDFSVIREIVEREIVRIFDHSVVLGKPSDAKEKETLQGLFSNIVFTDYQPTCENLVIDFAGRIIKKLPPEVRLHSLKLYETAGSYAEWFASDNQKQRND